MALLCILGPLAVAVEAAPLGLMPGAVPSPDLLACVVAAMALRRPRSAPLLLVWCLGLLRDLVTDVPPGAGALSLVLAAELLRRQGAAVGRRSLPVEWFRVAAVLLGMFALQYVLVLLSFAQPPYVMDMVRQWALTAALYPSAALVLRWVFGIRWQARER
jgi:rod shape-determining protein MreD